MFNLFKHNKQYKKPWIEIIDQINQDYDNYEITKAEYNKQLLEVVQKYNLIRVFKNNRYEWQEDDD